MGFKRKIQIFSGPLPSNNWFSEPVSIAEGFGFAFQVVGDLTGGTGSIEVGNDGVNWETYTGSSKSLSGSSWIWDVMESSCVYARINLSDLNGEDMVVNVSKGEIDGIY